MAFEPSRDLRAPTIGSTGASGLAVPGGPGFPAKPDYAPGPYGTNIGAVVENFSFVGYTQPHVDTADLEVVSLGDFYNPTADGVFPDDGRAWCQIRMHNFSMVGLSGSKHGGREQRGRREHCDKASKFADHGEAFRFSENSV